MLHISACFDSQICQNIKWKWKWVELPEIETTSYVFCKAFLAIGCDKRANKWLSLKSVTQEDDFNSFLPPSSLDPYNRDKEIRSDKEKFITPAPPTPPRWELNLWQSGYWSPFTPSPTVLALEMYTNNVFLG